MGRGGEEDDLGVSRAAVAEGIDPPVLPPATPAESPAPGAGPAEELPRLFAGGPKTARALPQEDYRHPTGVAELDAFLGGGLPAASVCLLMGPPFVGKELMARLFVSSGLKLAEGALVVLTDTRLGGARAGLQQLDPDYRTLENLGLIHYIDMRSGTGSADPNHHLARYLGPPWSAESLSQAVADGFALTATDLPVQRFVLASLTTFHAFVGSTVTLMALMRVADVVRSHGAAGMILVDPAAHAPAELQTMKRHVDGVIEFQDRLQGTEMRVVGFGMSQPSPWVRYQVRADAIALLGSWNEGRIA